MTKVSAPPSITRRLILALIGLITVLWLVSTGLAVAIMHHELEQSLDSSLQETAQRLLTLAVQNRIGAGGVVDATNEPAEGRLIVQHEEYLTYQIRDAAGKVVLRSHDAPAEPYSASLTPGFSNTDSVRIYTEGTVNGQYFIQVAETHNHRHEAVLEAILALALPLLLLVPFGAAAVHRIVGRCMAPVIAIQHEIAQRGAGNLTPLDSVGLATELQPITTAVDRLIERLRSALEAERAFAANSAHELRTPLASALAQVQRLRATLSDSAQADRVANIEQELRRLVYLSEKLLQLSRVDSGVAMTTSNQATDLLPILEMIVDDVSRSAKSDQRIQLEASASTLMSCMDIDAFGIVVRNLLENALLHGDPGSPVIIRAEGAGRLRFINAGPVVPADKLPTLTQRFARGATRATGAGLGLAIADTILKQSSGRLELRSPATSRDDGFEAIVDLK